MGEPIDINDRRPHLSGVGYCPECDHEWAAVVPEQGAITKLECPKCGKQGGILMPSGPITRRTLARLTVQLRTVARENNEMKDELGLIYETIGELLDR